MTPRLIAASYLGAYQIEVRFEDGKSGVINLEGELWGEVFEPLRDLALFRQFRFDEELDTIVWPTGADLAPEFLYEQAMASHGSDTEEATVEGDK